MSANFADYSDSFDEATWREMDAAMSETESVPLSPDMQLQMLFPLPAPAPPVSESRDCNIVQVPTARVDNMSAYTTSASAGCLTYDADPRLTAFPGNPPGQPRLRSGTAAGAPVAPHRASSSAHASTTLHNASPVLPMPVGTSTHPAASLCPHPSLFAPEPRRTHNTTKLRRSHTDPSFSHTGTEKRRRRTESRDLHPRQDDRALVSASRSRQRPLFVPSNATATPHLAVVPLPDVGLVDMAFPTQATDQQYRYPTPPASPLIAPALPAAQASSPQRENRGQMVWPGIYFST